MSAKHPDRATRLVKAAALFAAGKTYKEIAKAMGVSAERARQLVIDAGAFAPRNRKVSR